MIPTLKSKWAGAALVCAKCSKRAGGGFGPKGKTPLHKALRAVFGKGRKADFGIVGVKCLGVCPQGAVTMIDPRRPREWMIVRTGTPVADVVAALTDPL